MTFVVQFYILFYLLDFEREAFFMSNQQFDWDEIVQDCIKLIIEQTDQTKAISSINDLYVQLDITYRKNGNKMPSKNTFRQYLRKEMGLQERQSLNKHDFYEFAGAYDRLTVQSLVKDATIEYSSIDRNCSWLFITMERNFKGESAEQKYRMMQKHLYHLSHKLKEKFRTGVLFASFDRDTLVILCKDGDTRLAIRQYLDSCKPDIPEKKV